MKLEIGNNYNIGDIVKLYKNVGVYDREVKCPICKGRYTAINPNYEIGSGDEDKYDELLRCSICNHGKIKVKGRTEKIIANEKYRIAGIRICINDRNEITYRYDLESTPELNNRKNGYISKTDIEDAIALKVST